MKTWEGGADRVIETELDYAQRNLLQVKEADAVISMGGSSGVLTEVIAAVMDYEKPVVMFDDESESARCVKILSKIYPHVYFSSDLEKLVDFISHKISL